MFKLPLNERVVDGAYCDIKNESQRAELIRKSGLIIFDTLTACIEALERTLRDIRHSQAVYGGITICFSGDWHQCGPVVPFGSPADTVEASFISTYLWPKTTRMRLTISQRDREDPAYASFVRSIGEDRQPTSTLPDGAKLVPLSNECDPSTDDYFCLQYTTDFNDLIDFIYPNKHENARLLNNRAILATTNTSIDSCNNEISSRRRDHTYFYSSDSLIEDKTNPSSTAFTSADNLNNIDVPGVPPHRLELKSDALAMLTRNLNFSEGLVNGQKVVVPNVSPNSRVIQVELLNSDQDIVLIPRISFHPQVGRNGITFNRVQFPLRIAYSLTTNKSQGQTLPRIGLDNMRFDCFAHGQLYVALSRAKNRQSVMILLPPHHVTNNTPHVQNCVYPPFIEAAIGETPSEPSLYSDIPLTPLTPPHHNPHLPQPQNT